MLLLIILLALLSDLALALGADKGEDLGYQEFRAQDREVCPECAIDGEPERDGPAPEAPDSPRASLSISPDSWTVRKRVDEVTVSFTATRGRKFAQGLNREDITVTDDNEPVARISAFGCQRDLPLRLGLVVDTSGSVNPQFRAQQKAAVQFLRQIVRPGIDQAFVLGFANEATVTQDYSDDPERLAAGVAALREGGGTALHDAIVRASDKLMMVEDNQPIARILIVLSDGDDNASETTLAYAIEKAQTREVTIYTMHTSTLRFEPGRPPQGLQELKQIAVETGGLVFYQMDKREVTKAFSAIETEMRNRYVLSYQPVNLREDGRFHRIRIKAEKSGQRFRIRTRKGYYARLVSSKE